MRVEEIQEALWEQGLDGWLFADHHGRDPLAYRVLGLPRQAVTRRWYYLIPAEGEPWGLVHRVEAGVLERLPGRRELYASWRELEASLGLMLRGKKRVAMQYSPGCRLPGVSLVDAGTVEFVRSLGVEVVSSADLIQRFEARWTQEHLARHTEAGRRVDRIRREAFERVRSALESGQGIREAAIKQFILDRFASSGLLTDHGPIVASGPNSSDPHYEPQVGADREIGPGDVLVLDLWAKLQDPAAVYYDVTWVGYCGGQPPERVERVFRIVVEARDCAIELVRQRIRSRAPVRGFEVDDAARGYIERQGYGRYFPHRTGHSIGAEVHGAGANADNLETHDERHLIPWTCISVEPGIYLGDFGVRSEVNLFIGEEDAWVTGEIQRELILL
ncbi:MAG: M24 family metallopeptidase [Bryobacteraceae bacterium]